MYMIMTHGKSGASRSGDARRALNRRVPLKGKGRASVYVASFCEHTAPNTVMTRRPRSAQAAHGALLGTAGARHGRPCSSRSIRSDNQLGPGGSSRDAPPRPKLICEKESDRSKRFDAAWRGGGPSVDEPDASRRVDMRVWGSSRVPWDGNGSVRAHGSERGVRTRGSAWLAEWGGGPSVLGRRTADRLESGSQTRGCEDAACLAGLGQWW